LNLCASLFVALCCSAALLKAQTVSPEPLDKERVEIYRDFLAHYERYEQLSNLLGLQPITVPFEVPILFGDVERSDYGPRGCLHHIKLELPGAVVHRLPPELLAFGSRQSVMRRIKAAGKLKSPAQSTAGVGPDGSVLTDFKVSEIVYDSTHHYAAFFFSASCKCLGGQGGMVLYEHVHGRWKRSDRDCDYWEG
jgi:hypothetical protein